MVRFGTEKSEIQLTAPRESQQIRTFFYNIYRYCQIFLIDVKFSDTEKNVGNIAVTLLEFNKEYNTTTV